MVNYLFGLIIIAFRLIPFVCQGKRIPLPTSIQNVSPLNETSWFHSMQKSWDSRSVSKVVLLILIALLILIILCFTLKIIRHFSSRRQIAEIPNSPVFSISQKPYLVINNFNIVINSDNFCSCKDDSKDVKDEFFILEALKNYLHNTQEGEGSKHEKKDVILKIK